MGSSRDRGSAESALVVSDRELRFYRVPSHRASVTLEVLIFIVVLVAIALEASRTPLLIPVGVVGFVLVCVGLRRDVLCGVEETPAGIVCRAGGKQWGSASFAWSEMRTFKYVRFAVREQVIVELHDGRRGVVHGARRRMHWRGGATDDFAATLSERLLQMRSAPPGVQGDG
jgi:hypothetical protein